jgi:hypothetical protein
MILDLNKAKMRFASQRANAKNRNIAFNLSFDEWYNWWLNQGIDKRLPTIKNAQTPCMCRYNDSGAYELGNIYYDTTSNNIKNSFKLRQANSSYRNGRARTVTTPNGSFPSIKEAANAYSISGSTMMRWLKENSKEFYRDF